MEVTDWINMPSFGDGARLDYGTGHELNFVAFLCCLEAHKIFTIDQRTNVIHSIFKHYIAVTRTIQQHFRYERLTQDATGADYGRIGLNQQVHTVRGVLMTTVFCLFYGNIYAGEMYCH